MTTTTSTSTQCEECNQRYVHVVKNVNKIFREYEGYASFKEWFDTENNIYIGRNAAKYVNRDVQESKWINPLLSEFIKDNYENLVRNTPLLIESLHELKGKQLGCWCNPKQCHGDFLVKLYKEFCEKYKYMEPISCKFISNKFIIM